MEIAKFALNKYPFIPKNLICQRANISRSGLYASLNRIPSEKDAELKKKMLELFFKRKKKLGIRRYKMELEREYGMIVNLKRIHRIIKEGEINTTVRLKNKHRQNNERVEKVSVSPNVLNRQFKITAPEKILATDVTCLKTKGGKCYLSVMKDIASGEISAYEISKNNDTLLVMNTIKKLTIIPGMIHSDGGGAYKSFEYIQYLNRMNITRSMSHPGTPIDNAPVESFFGHFKDECEYKNCKNLKDLRDKIDEYMYYYNMNRPQWNRNRMTPFEYKDFLNKSYIFVHF